MKCRSPHVVVTGASSGIGRAGALKLAGLGYHVYAGIRRVEDGAALRDVVSGHVGEAGLVDNAGIGVAWPLELVPLREFRRQFEVNVDGQLAVTQAFLPLLRRARGRLIIIGSIGDKITMPFSGPLTASKCAIAAIADAFRQELAPRGVAVVLIEPASIHTAAIGKLRRDADRAIAAFPPGGKDLYQDAYQRMIQTAIAGEQHGSPPGVMAETVARALSARRPRARYLAGKDARLLAARAAASPASCREPRQSVRAGNRHRPAAGSWCELVPAG